MSKTGKSAVCIVLSLVIFTIAAPALAQRGSAVGGYGYRDAAQVNINYISNTQ